jgi:hypothetical protein
MAPKILNAKRRCEEEDGGVGTQAFLLSKDVWQYTNGRETLDENFVNKLHEESRSQMRIEVRLAKADDVVEVSPFYLSVTVNQVIPR